MSPELPSEPTKSNKIVQIEKSINTINSRRHVFSRKGPLKSSLSKKSNIYLYIVTLAISYFLLCLNSIIFPVIYSGCYVTCRRSYLFLWYSLKMAYPLRNIFIHFSYILRVFIFLDRLWALEFPFTYRTKMSNSFIEYLILIGFIVTCLMTIPYNWGFIAVKEIKLKPITNNQCYINEMLPECKYFKLIDVGKYNSRKNYSDSRLDNHNENTYLHSLNPKAHWFITYRKWINFSISFIPFTITTIANVFIIRKCYKISHNRINLQGSNYNSVVPNRKPNLLKWLNRILHLHSRTNHNKDNMKKNSLSAVKKRKFQITILMLVSNVHFVITTIPMTLYMFMYDLLIDRFSTNAKLWLQNIAFLSKYGNNALMCM
ncbi:unnamed protein product [Gordionus sp. m RMFG-2023]